VRYREEDLVKASAGELIYLFHFNQTLKDVKTKFKNENGIRIKS
jgi:hypothetical protein